MKKYVVAVVGATGMVGREMIKTLEQRDFPVEKLVPLASERSAGKTVVFKGQEIPISVAEAGAFAGVQIGLFSPGASVSKLLAPQAVKAGTVIIDNTSAFRLEPDVPLVVPEVNKHALKKHKGLIANPNCSTVQLVVVLKPIHDVARIKRVVVATYQSASGAGKEAVEELIAQTTSLIEKRKFDGIGETFEPKYLPRQIAFNVIPQIDVFQGNNYTKEEMKMVLETKKIMEDDSIKVTATCVRVPVIIGHSEAVNIETGKKLTPAQVREILSKAKGVRVIDDPINKVYPTPIDAASLDETLVGRIREDISHPSAIDLWIVSDNLRKGAALNAVQIAEALVEMKLV
jgi:aspartate-semialdehyde dehydrogenase